MNYQLLYAEVSGNVYAGLSDAEIAAVLSVAFARADGYADAYAG